MFLIREGRPGDFRGVLALAKLLDSYNLPADQAYVRQLLETSQASFQGALPRRRARYLFVLEEQGRIVGCSLILAKHGVPGAPHLWFAEEKVVKRSRTLRIRRTHEVLRMGYTENGPTEIGGLVVLPGFRRHRERCGLQVGLVRFLYMGMHPDRFEPEVLVEYRGAMGAGHRSPFWEAIGRIFTGLPYHRADRLSVANKEFILNLLPREPIYCALLPQSVRAAIGAVHPSAERASKIARSQGFRRIPQIEPFDGGPYYSARLREIRMVRRTRRVIVGSPFVLSQISARGGSASGGEARTEFGCFLVGTEANGWFRAVLAPGKVVCRRWIMPEGEMRLLNVRPGNWVYVSPV